MWKREVPQALNRRRWQGGRRMIKPPEKEAARQGCSVPGLPLVKTVSSLLSPPASEYHPDLG